MFLTDGMMLRDFKDLENLGIIVEYMVVRDQHGKDTYDLTINNDRVAYGLSFSEFAGMLHGFAIAQKPAKSDQVKQAEAELSARAIAQHLASNNLTIAGHDDLLDHEQNVQVLTEALCRIDA